MNELNDVIIENKETSFCYTCRGNGLEDKPCPECGKQADDILAEKVKNLDELEIGKNNKDKIPTHYRGKIWSAKELIKDYRDKDEELDFMEYVKVLNMIHRSFAKGHIPEYSAFIISPKRMSKTVFAYSCMQYAMVHGKTVAPLYDALQVSQKIKAGDMEDILADVMFMVIQQGYTRTSAWQTILEVLDMRSRINKSTFILSEFSLHNISLTDKEKRFIKIIDRTCSGDPKKYPRVLELQDDSFNGGVRRC